MMDNLHNVSTHKAASDKSKGAKLEALSGMVEAIAQQLRERKATLQPEITKLREAR